MHYECEPLGQRARIWLWDDTLGEKGRSPWQPICGLLFSPLPVNKTPPQEPHKSRDCAGTRSDTWLPPRPWACPHILPHLRQTGRVPFKGYPIHVTDPLRHNTELCFLWLLEMSALPSHSEHYHHSLGTCAQVSWVEHICCFLGFPIGPWPSHSTNGSCVNE